MDETIMSKQCRFCSEIKSRGVDEDFSKWFTYHYQEHKNSTEEKSVFICPRCITI